VLNAAEAECLAAGDQVRMELASAKWHSTTLDKWGRMGCHCFCPL